MFTDLLLRFLIGGIVVSLFALIGDVFKPKSFAGLFSAAPSIALGSLGLALTKQGSDYAAMEGRSMIVGAIAFFFYSQVVSWLILRHKVGVVMASTSSLLLWCVTAFAIWAVVLT